MNRPCKAARGAEIALLVATLLAIASSAAAQDTGAMSDETRARIRAATTPGERQEELERFVGEWDVEIALHVPGGPEQHASGHATYEWLIPGRWIAQHLTDDLLGEPHESFAILGYDNFARSYVVAGVSSFDTSLDVSRGPVVDPDGDVIVTYGTQNDYVTGRLRKPYKIVTRILDPDHHVVETWDLGAGPEGAKILEYRYTRE